MSRNSPDEGLIHAWLDGELSAEESARVEQLVREDAAWAAAASEARGLMAASSRILSALDVVPADVAQAGSRAAPPSGSRDDHSGRSFDSPRTRWRFRVRPWMRAAAALVIVVGTAVVVTDRVDVDAAFEPAGGDARATVEVQPQGPSQPPPSALADADRRMVADSSPARKSTSQSLAVAPAPPPVPQSDSFEAARAVTPSEIPPVGDALRLRSERGFGAVSVDARPMAAGASVSATVLDGCWRTITRARVDSVLVSPRITGTTGRMLTILTGDRIMSVVQQADTLLGTIVDSGGTRVPFRAERIVCR